MLIVFGHIILFYDWRGDRSPEAEVTLELWG